MTKTVDNEALSRSMGQEPRKEECKHCLTNDWYYLGRMPYEGTLMKFYECCTCKKLVADSPGTVVEYI